MHRTGSWCAHSIKHTEYILVEKTLSRVCQIEQNSFFGVFWYMWRDDLDGVISYMKGTVSMASQTRESAVREYSQAAAVDLRHLRVFVS